MTSVDYAGLPGHPDYERAQRYFPLGPGAVFGFEIKGGLEAGKRFIDSVKLASHVANILDAKTLVIHPASTTHQQLTPEEQLKAGVTPGLDPDLGGHRGRARTSSPISIRRCGRRRAGSQAGSGRRLGKGATWRPYTTTTPSPSAGRRWCG